MVILLIFTPYNLFFNCSMIRGTIILFVFQRRDIILFTSIILHVSSDNEISQTDKQLTKTLVLW